MPVVVALSELAPKPELLSPIVLAVSAPYPCAVLSPPVVLFPKRKTAGSSIKAAVLIEVRCCQTAVQKTRGRVRRKSACTHRGISSTRSVMDNAPDPTALC